MTEDQVITIKNVQDYNINVVTEGSSTDLVITIKHDVQGEEQ